MHTVARIILLLSGHWKAVVGRIGQVRWDFAAGGALLLAGGAILALLIALLCYRRTTEGLTSRARVGLGTLRLVSLLILLVIASGAVATIDVATREKPRLLLLVDDSPSMALPLGNSTRAAAAQEALNEKGGLLSRLQKQFDVRVATTSGRPPGSSDDAMPQNLAAGLVREATKSFDRPISQILVISDGAQLGSGELARAAVELPAPCSTLVVGDANVNDVILQNVSVPPFVYQGDRAMVTAEVRSLGYSGAVTLQLTLLTGGSDAQLADAHVNVKAGEEPVFARLQFKAEQAGIQKYRVRVVPVPGELSLRNNQIDFHLDVRPEKIRVLFIEGAPSWEYKYVKEAMEKDKAVKFYGLVRLPGDEWLYQGDDKRPDGKPVISSPKGGFPVSADEMNFFDVLIVGDLERKIFEQANRYELIDSFVKNRGGGVMTIGGLSVYGAGDYAGTPLAHMLPFEIEKEKKQQLINRFNPLVTASGLMHPTMQLEFNPEDNLKAWEHLPWVEGGNAIRQIKPSATLLMVHPKLKTPSGARPVAAAWQYGAGRVLSSALDGTWHWSLGRENDEPNYHARYWGLVARWLANDPRASKAAGSLVLEDPVLEVARPVTVFLSLHDGSGAPITDAEADFTVTFPQEAAKPGEPDVKAEAASAKAPAATVLHAHSKSDAAVPGRYSITFVPPATGEYLVQSSTARTGEQPVKHEQRYLVSPSRAEFLDPRPDARALADLATATGGTSAPLSQSAQLTLAAGDEQTQITHIVIAVWQLPALMGLAIAGLSVEWLMRKRRGLS